MVQPQTILKVADNTGAREIMCIRVLRGARKNNAKIGDIIVAVVKKAKPHASVKKSEIVRALIIRTKKTVLRPNGMSFRFSDNAAVLITKEMLPKGTRIFGPIPYECRKAGFTTLMALAPFII